MSTQTCVYLSHYNIFNIFSVQKLLKKKKLKLKNSENFQKPIYRRGQVCKHCVYTCLFFQLSPRTFYTQGYFLYSNGINIVRSSHEEHKQKKSSMFIFILFYVKLYKNSN